MSINMTDEWLARNEAHYAKFPDFTGKFWARGELYGEVSIIRADTLEGLRMACLGRAHAPVITNIGRDWR